MEQPITVGIVAVRAHRLSALDRILVSALTGREIDVIHLGIGGGVRPSDVKKTGPAQLGVFELTLDLDVLLEPEGCAGHIQYVDECLGPGVHGQYHRLSSNGPVSD